MQSHLYVVCNAIFLSTFDLSVTDNNSSLFAVNEYELEKIEAGKGKNGPEILTDEKMRICFDTLGEPLHLSFSIPIFGCKFVWSRFA